jgi:hypothetical protein
MGAAPSMPVALAVAMPSTDADRIRTAPPSRTRLVWIAAAQLLWACVGTASGVTGVGGTPLHVALGLSLVALLAWSVRVTPPLRAAASGLRVALILAIAASAVALVARAQPFEAAVLVHVVLAIALLIGLIRAARCAWNHRRTTILAMTEV